MTNRPKFEILPVLKPTPKYFGRAKRGYEILPIMDSTKGRQTNGHRTSAAEKAERAISKQKLEKKRAKAAEKLAGIEAAKAAAAAEVARAARQAERRAQMRNLAAEAMERAGYDAVADLGRRTYRMTIVEKY